MPLGQVCLSDNSLNRLRLFRLDDRAVMETANRYQTDLQSAFRWSHDEGLGIIPPGQ